MQLAAKTLFFFQSAFVYCGSVKNYLLWRFQTNIVKDYAPLELLLGVLTAANQCSPLAETSLKQYSGFLMKTARHSTDIIIG